MMVVDNTLIINNKKLKKNKLNFSDAGGFKKPKNKKLSNESRCNGQSMRNS